MTAVGPMRKTPLNEQMLSLYLKADAGVDFDPLGASCGLPWTQDGS